MKNNFNDCLSRLLKDEGGYSNDPRDPGGPTNFGITLTDYKLYINKNGTAADVKKMTVAQATTIYKEKYWDALNCDTLSSGVDYAVFDYGVNSGLARPRNDLKKFANLKGTALIDAICDERMAFLKALPTFSVFGRGWTRRVAGVRAYSKQLATQKSATGGVAVAAGVAGAATLASQHSFWHNHQYLVISAGVAAAVLLGVIVHYLLNKGKV
jgi:lysozyme family protein